MSLSCSRFSRFFLFFFSRQNDSDDEISHLEWETVRVRFVKAATLDRLVDALVTDDGELESTFVNVFLGECQLSSYSFCVQRHQILKLLIFIFLTHSNISDVHEDGKSFGASAASV